MKHVSSEPKASSLIESLRDIGYSLESAVADIIDNSITARCRKVDLFFDWDERRPFIAILDNGDGMTQKELLKAMRPGSMSPLEKRASKDLGRFGLGLKTASFSQGRKLTVVSRKKGVINACCWDLDFVTKEDKWLLQVLNLKEAASLPHFDSIPESGTLVVWEQLDRVIDQTASQNTEANLYEKMDLVRRHLELVFHRYLKGEPGLERVSIYMNNDELSPFDPFNSKHRATQLLPEERLPFKGETIVIQPYILPHHSKTNRKTYEYYAGDAGYLKNQGFYVYRNARLLISGSWFRLARQSELTKLARVKIDLPNNLDHLWSIDVKKSRATPPAAIRLRLKGIIDKITGSSKRIYKKRGRKLTDDRVVSVWNRNAGRGEIFYTVNREHPLMQKFSAEVDDDKLGLFFDVLELIESRFPADAFYADFSSSPEDVSQDQLEKEKIISLAEIMLEDLKSQNLSINEILNFFNITDPFRKHFDLCDKFLKSRGVQ